MNHNYIHYSDIKIKNWNSGAFFFHFHISLDYAVICRYCRLNLLVPRCSIGINCYSLPLQKRVYSKSQHKRCFNYFYSRTQDKINLYRIIYILQTYIYQIVVSCIKYFIYMDGYDIFVPTMWCKMKMGARKGLSFFIYSLLLLDFNIEFPNRKFWKRK